jgi:hypothetical protein
VYEVQSEFFREGIDFKALRERLHIPDEPEPDPATVNLDTLHLSRLHRVAAEELDDDRLLTLYLRAREAMLPMALERAATAVAARPSLMGRPDVGPVAVANDLMSLSQARGDEAGAYAIFARMKGEDPAARTSNALSWDLTEIRLQATTRPPETWVPNLAVVLEKYRADEAAGPVILGALVDLGLIRLSPHPEDPSQVLLDSRALQAVLAEYGPRITTASGTLGVSATKGGIWTPGSSPAPGGSTTAGGLWTPGSGPASGASDAGGAKKSPLIIPGR